MNKTSRFGLVSPLSGDSLKISELSQLSNRSLLRRQSGANGDRQLAADLHPELAPIGPSAQFEGERIRTQLDEQRLRRRLASHERVSHSGFL